MDYRKPVDPLLKTLDASGRALFAVWVTKRLWREFGDDLAGLSPKASPGALQAVDALWAHFVDGAPALPKATAADAVQAVNDEVFGGPRGPDLNRAPSEDLHRRVRERGLVSIVEALTKSLEMWATGGSLKLVEFISWEPFNVIVTRVEDDYDAHGDERHPDIEAEAALQVRVLQAILAGGPELGTTLRGSLDGPDLGFPRSRAA
jgi:hypothetical protein